MMMTVDDLYATVLCRLLALIVDMYQGDIQTIATNAGFITEAAPKLHAAVTHTSSHNQHSPRGHTISTIHVDTQSALSTWTHIIL